MQVQSSRGWKMMEVKNQDVQLIIDTKGKLIFSTERAIGMVLFSPSKGEFKDPEEIVFFGIDIQLRTNICKISIRYVYP